MAKVGRPAVPVPPARALDDPAWFGAVMGSAATATAAALHPGQIGRLTEFARRNGDDPADRQHHGLRWPVYPRLPDSRPGPQSHWETPFPAHRAGHATIPGAISVLTVAVIRVWPTTISSTAGWWMLVTLAGVGTVLGRWLTVVFFVAAFEHEQFQAEDISGIWFIPETVVLLGSFLFAELAPTVNFAKT